MAPELDHERRVRKWVQTLLRSGLLASFVLMLGGLALALGVGTRAAPPVPSFRFGTAAELGDTAMTLGILVLAATPVLRVLSLLVLWSREHDWRFTGVAFAVLAIMIAAIALGHA